MLRATVASSSLCTDRETGRLEVDGVQSATQAAVSGRRILGGVDGNPGLLDRIDALLFAAPLFYLAVRAA